MTVKVDGGAGAPDPNTTMPGATPTDTPTETPTDGPTRPTSGTTPAEPLRCTDCGKPVARLIAGSCAECFVKRTPMLSAPDVIDVELCAHCEARRVGKRWVDLAQDARIEWAREDAVREAVRVHPRVESAFLQFDETALDTRTFAHDVTLEGDVEGVRVRQTQTITVRQKRGVCDRCSRMYGDYYAAIIQLRATDRGVTLEELEKAHKLVGDELDRQRASGNRAAFLTKSGSEHGGWDYYLGDIEGARQVARALRDALGASIQETAKLVGKRSGDNVYRVTFLVRIHLFASGDYAVTKDGRFVQVQGVHHGYAGCLDMLRHEKTRVPEGDLRRLGGREREREAVLVSASATEFQVLDPVSLRTVDVLRPAGYPETPTVRIVRHEERAYLSPVSNKS